MDTQKKEVTGSLPSLPGSWLYPIILDSMLLSLILPVTILAPFTKVEESFNLHATHDVIMYGVGSSTLHNYDHFTFPGVVPRTFVGSVFLGWVVRLFLWIHGWSDGGKFHPKLEMQSTVRFVLLCLNYTGLRRMRVAISRRFDMVTASSFVSLVVLQFHLPFWAGRTLPNMFALITVTHAFSFLIDQSPSQKKPSEGGVALAIALLTFTAVVFRAEVLLLLIPIAVQCLYLRYISFRNLFIVGLVSGLASLYLTVTVDSYFWDRPYVWPEFSSIFFNVYEGKSAEWGTSSPLAYFTTHLPKLLLSSFPLSIIGFSVDQRIRTLLLPCLVFVGLISLLPHKEWRFIVYVVPMFTLAAARGASWLPREAARSRNWHAFFVLFCYGLMICGGIMKGIIGRVSNQNYPGGDALMLFHKTYAPNYTTPLSTPPHVHICNLAAQTGASLFMQFNAPPYHPSFVKPKPNPSSPFQIPSEPWIYNKTENLSIRDLTLSAPITHLISEVNPETEEGVGMEKDWKLVAPVTTRSRFVPSWKVLKGEWPWEHEARLWIYERRWSRVGA